MSAKGFTTFNIDRVSTGESSRVPAVDDDYYTNAFVVHQLIQKLRAGEIGDRSFGKVALVAHSLGTVIGMVEA